MNTGSKVLMALLVFSILLMPGVIAPKPSTTSTASQGFDIEYKGFDTIKIYENKTFHYHVFNKSDGLPIRSGISCTFHLYQSQGDHLQIQTINVVDDIYDYEFKVDAFNFSHVGEYHVITQCNNSVLGGFVSYGFLVTQTGNENPTDILTTFFVLTFILFIALLLYTTIKTFGHFLTKDFDFIDLSINMGIYFGLLAYYFFEMKYLNDTLINSILNVLIIAGAITHVVFSLILLMACLIWRSMEAQARKEGGTI